VKSESVRVLTVDSRSVSRAVVCVVCGGAEGCRMNECVVWGERGVVERMRLCECECVFV
jgi:hypothetical protein